MGSRRAQAVIPLALLAALAAVVAATQPLGLDYRLEPGDNNASPTLRALLAGDLTTAGATQPAMGAFSLLLRLPFVAFAGGDLLAQYRAGVFACLVVVVGLAFVTDRRLAVTGAPVLRRVITGAAFIAAPLVVAAFDNGHPEEALAGALAVLAVLAAMAQRPVAAGVLLGLAVGTKQPVLVAGVPVLLALDRGWARATLVAGLVAVACTVPGVIADPDRYGQVAASLGDAARVYPQTLWWPVAERTHIMRDLGGGEIVPATLYAMPAGLTRTHAGLLQVLAALVVLAATWRARRRVDPLGLLVALLVLRAALDPMNLDYYLAPAWLALVVWEAWRRPVLTLPVVTLLAGIAWWWLWPWRLNPDAHTLWFVTWAVLTLPALALGWSRRGQDSGAVVEPSAGARAG